MHPPLHGPYLACHHLTPVLLSVPPAEPEDAEDDAVLHRLCPTYAQVGSAVGGAEGISRCDGACRLVAACGHMSAFNL